MGTPRFTKMEYEDKKKCLWHAFFALDEHKTGTLKTSQLKVLTFKIGGTFGLNDAQNKLQDYKDSAEELSFLDYMAFLKTEVFSQVEDKNKNHTDLQDEKLDQVCWMICETKYSQREKKFLRSNEIYKLWRIFNFLAETDEEGHMEYPVVVDCEEVGYLTQRACDYLKEQFESDLFESIYKEIPQFIFQQMLHLFENQICCDMDQETAVDLVNELYSEIILEVAKKGYLYKKGHVITSWKERWFVLDRHNIKYFTTREENEMKGDISITKDSKVEVLPEKTGAKPNRFQISGTGKLLEISAPDLRTKNEWIKAIKEVISGHESQTSRQREFLQKRKTVREAKRKKEREEAMRRKRDEEEMESTKKELDEARKAREEAIAQLQKEAEDREKERKRLEEEDARKEKDRAELLSKTNDQIQAERLAREQVEARLREEAEAKELEKHRREELELLSQKEKEELMLKSNEQIEAERLARLEIEEKYAMETEQRELETKRREELEALQTQLEKSLEEERQAKRDEEIVRALQARVLEEEFQKREQLEKLQSEQAHQLEEEKKKRENLEELKLKQETMLRQERVKLQELESKRCSYLNKLEEAKFKLIEAEKTKQELLDKVKEKEKPIGLARPIAPGENTRIITHRGEGAFTNKEFAMKRALSLDSNVRTPSPRKSPVEADLAE